MPWTPSRASAVALPPGTSPPTPTCRLIRRSACSRALTADSGAFCNGVLTSMPGPRTRAQRLRKIPRLGWRRVCRAGSRAHVGIEGESLRVVGPCSPSCRAGGLSVWCMHRAAWCIARHGVVGDGEVDGAHTRRDDEVCGPRPGVIV
jgi:hypothetical protein